jgi:sulfur carrier protein
MMEVTVDVKGGECRQVDAEGTYADLLDAVDLSPHEASVLVDGRLVPADDPIETDAVTVLRLVRGG